MIKAKHKYHGSRFWPEIKPLVENHNSTLRKHTGTLSNNVGGDVHYVVLYDDSIYQESDVCHGELCNGENGYNSVAISNGHYLTSRASPEMYKIQRWIFDGDDSPWAGCFSNPDWDHVLEYGFIHSANLPASLFGQLCMPSKQIRERSGFYQKNWELYLKNGFTPKEAYLMGMAFYWDKHNKDIYWGGTYSQSPWLWAYNLNKSLFQIIKDDFHFAKLKQHRNTFNELGYYEGSRYREQIDWGDMKVDLLKRVKKDSTVIKTPNIFNGGESVERSQYSETESLIETAKNILDYIRSSKP